MIMCTTIPVFITQTELPNLRKDLFWVVFFLGVGEWGGKAFFFYIWQLCFV